MNRTYISLGAFNINKIDFSLLSALNLHDLKTALDMIRLGGLQMENNIDTYRITEMMFDNKMHDLKSLVYICKDHINFYTGDCDKYLSYIDVKDLMDFKRVMPTERLTYFLNHKDLTEDILTQMLESMWLHERELYDLTLKNEFSGNFIIQYKSKLFYDNLDNINYVTNRALTIFNSKQLSKNLDIINISSVLLKNINTKDFPLDKYKDFVKVLVDNRVTVNIFEKDSLTKLFKNIYAIAENSTEFIEILYSILPEYLHSVLTIRLCKNPTYQKYINLSPSELVTHLNLLGYKQNSIIEYLLNPEIQNLSNNYTRHLPNGKYTAKDVLGRCRFAEKINNESDGVIFDKTAVYTISEILQLAKNINDINKVNILSGMIKRVPNILPKVCIYNNIVLDVADML